MDKNVYKEVSERANGKCEVCGKYCGDRLELHHILRRKVKETSLNCIMTCPECHRGTNGVHGMNGHILDSYLKMKVQTEYFLQDLPQKEIIKLMGGHFVID